MSIIVEVERAVGWSRLWDLVCWTMAQSALTASETCREWLCFRPMPCLHAPCARRRTSQETLSFLTSSPLIQDAPVAATNFYHYFYQSLTLTQLCLTTCVPWITYSELLSLFCTLYAHRAFAMNLLTFFPRLRKQIPECSDSEAMLFDMIPS